MEVSFEAGGKRLVAFTGSACDACIPVRPYEGKEEQTHCFHLPPAAAAPFAAGSFVASVSAGASINCPVVSSMCFHSNGTHTECVGHALPGRVTLLDVFGSAGPRQVLTPALLLTVTPVRLGDTDEQYAPGAADDLVVVASLLDAAAAAVRAAWADEWEGPPGPLAMLSCGGALVIRTLPNTADKGRAAWSGSNPPYLTPSAMHWAGRAGAAHLLCDLPSADREDDAGLLLAHRAWWGLPPKGTPREGEGGGGVGGVVGVEVPAPLSTRTITELCYIPGPPHPGAPATGYPVCVDELAAAGGSSTSAPLPCPDGPYLLNLCVAPIALDAAPSRPLLYPVAVR